MAIHSILSTTGFNIVPCYGLTLDVDKKSFALVLELMKYNLREFLIQNNSAISFTQKIIILSHIIGALTYIHKSNITHRDLHSMNILYNIKGMWYVGDFGFSQVEENSKTKVYGNLPYIAPEILRKCPYTTSSDIYSFGILMWEILIEKPPFHNREHNNLLMLDIIKGIRPGLVKEPRWYVSIMKRCWDAIPENRPTINEIVFAQSNKQLFKKSQSKLYSFEDLPEPRNATEEEQEAYDIQQQNAFNSNDISTDMSVKIDSEELYIDIIN
ncbi:kinase-like domain-containing protein [Gigaspora rosea]|uniref:Kinase-like domain-containing protein n=1 Tax=Gigaspora rosea TaxID=44941 RepID=A0A397VV55_9GLOM|nr:kinase-like domain-containing protein [Gigaspora rosea]